MVILETITFVFKSPSADIKMASSHFSLNESMEIISSRNFRRGRRTEAKKILSIPSCVQTKKDLMFDLLHEFPLSFYFPCVLYFIWKGIIIVCSRFLFGEKREKIRYEKEEKNNLQLCPCHHKLLIVIMKERREKKKMASVWARLQYGTLHFRLFITLPCWAMCQQWKHRSTLAVRVIIPTSQIWSSMIYAHGHVQAQFV